jgi:hypothetical protein
LLLLPSFVNQRIDLARPTINATTTLDNATALRVSVNMCLPPTPYCAMPPIVVIVDAEETGLVHLGRPLAKTCSNNDVVA